MNFNIRALGGRLPANDSTLIYRFRNHLSLAVVLTMVMVPVCAQDVVSGTNGQIAFNRGAAFEGGKIWLMNPDGSAQTQLTKNEINAAGPRWSPDGTRIAFERYNNQLISQIYVIRADGTGLLQLTNDAANSSHSPTWSPDGTKIAFGKSFGGGPSRDVYVMNSDGTGVTNLTNNSARVNGEPAWSPDGTRIAFTADTPNTDVWAMNADGTGQTNLTASLVIFNDGRHAQSGLPAWSPDSSKIAFSTNKDGLAVFHIYLMAPDGSGLTQQTNVPAACSPAFASDVAPTWSPDGTELAFARFLGCTTSHIVVMNAATPESGGNSPVDLSGSGANLDLFPDWAVAVPPCGKRICH